MSFGFAPLAYSPFGFGHGSVDSLFDSFFDAPARSFFGRDGRRTRRLRPTIEEEVIYAPRGRCVPWRRTRRSVPSVLDLLSIGPDIESIWDSLERNVSDEVPKIAAASTEATVPPSTPESTQTALVPTATAEMSHKFGTVDQKRLDNGTHFDIHLPGLSLGDVKLDFDFKRHALFVKAEKKVEDTKEDEHGKRSFVRHVSMSRSLPIPHGVKPEDVTADFVDGVLSISVAHKTIEAPADSPITTSLPITSPTTTTTPSTTSTSTETRPTSDEFSTTDKSDLSATPASEASSSSNPNPASYAAKEKSGADFATVEDAE
jgi:HSP20 family molecular chaperone IbpA